LLINLDLKRYQTGAAQPGLSVKNLQEIQIISVPLEEQNRFAEFVVQVDKSKAVVQKSLDKMQLLFDSLMQQYFG
jgi:type I restriction enzyme S subunit